MFILDRETEAVTLENGVTRKIKGYLDDLMVCELHWNKGQVGDVHAHPHRQCGYIIRGSFGAQMEGKKQVLRAGDCFYAEKDVPHGLVCLEDDSLMLDIFTPKRDDFLK